MIVLVATGKGKDEFFCDNLEEGLSVLATTHRAVMRLFQHPKTGEVRVPGTPKKLYKLVQHLIDTKQLPSTRIHTQQAIFKSRMVTGVRIKSFARKAEEYLITWPQGTLRIRFHANLGKGLFYFYYTEA